MSYRTTRGTQTNLSQKTNSNSNDDDDGDDDDKKNHCLRSLCCFFYKVYFLSVFLPVSILTFCYPVKLFSVHVDFTSPLIHCALVLVPILPMLLWSSLLE